MHPQNEVEKQEDVAAQLDGGNQPAPLLFFFVEKQLRAFNSEVCKPSCERGVVRVVALEMEVAGEILQAPGKKHRTGKKISGFERLEVTRKKKAGEG